ncbi:MAG TPA: class I SAM-dependent methyltransferase [Candidatus Binataceae bacterium]|nr:class I SAM-dependent methyltransferase [Candidatus Binataceae bacterium]
MSLNERADWDLRHREWRGAGPESFVLELLPLLPRGLALDVACGAGRHSIFLGRCGYRVHAVDFSLAAIEHLARSARQERLEKVQCLVADLEHYPLPADYYDLIVNINYLDRQLIPRLKRALKPGGALLFETFLIDQAQVGHPSNPRFLLGHYELRELMAGLELTRYRECLTVSPEGVKSWRAGALGRRQ